MKNIFLLFLAFSLFFIFSCAGTPEADPPDLAQYNPPVEKEIEKFEEFEEINDVVELNKIDEFEVFKEIDDVEKIENLEEISDIAWLEDVEKLEEIDEVNEIDVLQEIDEVAEFKEVEELVEIEEPQEPEVLYTVLLPDEESLDEEPLIEDIFNDIFFDKPEELVEVAPTVDEPTTPEIVEETVIAEEPHIIQTPQVTQAPQVIETPQVVQATQTPQVTETPQVVQAPPIVQTPPPQTQPVREQPVQTPTPVPRQQPSQTTVPPSLLSPAEAPAVSRDIAAEQSNIPFRNDLGEQSVPARQGIITPQNDEVVFSRIVRATVGQIVEIPFIGTGWVYLGELASRRGIAYVSSRRESEGQSLIFRAEEAGTYVLRFFKEDFIRGYILNDHVQVIVGEAPSAGGAGWFNPPIDRGRVTAEPRWPSALEEAEILRGGSGMRPSDSPPTASPSSGASATAQGTVPAQETTSAQGTVPYQPQAGQPTTSSPPVTMDPPAASTVPERQERLSPEDMIQRAKEAFDAGNVAAAIALLDQFREYYPSGSDEAYWLYGQFYEANSPSRDILLALDYYRRLVREYPQSSRVSDARRRIAYLERFYINIQ